MALPSSPPPLPEPDLFNAPHWHSDATVELPTRSTDTVAPPLRPGFTRKRQLSDYGSLSSDPLFSEDPSEADAAEYSHLPRRKRWIKGPWWNEGSRRDSSLRRGIAKRDRMMRNADSGVWMGSDTSEDTVESTLGSPLCPAIDDEEDGKPLECPDKGRLHNSAEHAARTAIQTCLEHGLESVDLTNMDLGTLSNETVQPLHALIRNPHTDLTRPPSEDEFGPLTPSIQLYLSGNRLSSLPSELFNLTNLTVLSLRNNNIDHIPPAIGRLHNLKELNLAQNRLRFLPWELFGLVQSKGGIQFNLRPNPFLEPTEIKGPYPLPRPNATPSERNDALSEWGEIDGAFHRKMQEWYRRDGVAWGTREELEIRLKLGRTRRMNYLEEASCAGRELKLSQEPLIFLAPSAIRFFDVDGSLYRKGYAITADTEDFSANLGVPTPAPDPSANGGLASLFELSLRSLVTVCSSSTLRSVPTSYPDRVCSGLSAAAQSIEFGSEACTTCGKPFIIARAEWVEYWFNGFPSQEGLTQETVLPFKRRACSWQCAVPTSLGGFRF